MSDLKFLLISAILGTGAYLLKNRFESTVRVDSHVMTAWREAAKQMGGVFGAGERSLIIAPSLSIAAKVSGIDLEIEMVDGGHRGQRTVFRARTSAPSSLQLKVVPRTVVRDIARAIGLEQTPTGNAQFDQRFIVRSNQPLQVPLWLNSSVRRQLEKAGIIEVSLDSRVLAVTLNRAVSQSRELVKVAESIALVAKGESELAKAWRALGKRLGGRTKWRHGRRQIELQRDGVEVAVEIEQHGHHYQTRATATAAGRVLEPFVLSQTDAPDSVSLPRAEPSFDVAGYTMWANRPDALAGTIGRLKRPLERLGIASLEVRTHGVVAQWPGIQIGHQRIERAVELIVSLASRSDDGPYR